MMKNNKGFSLVELIVVIAIMAVLAAVAVVGVSIYIPKAQEAADKDLMNVLTDALVAACLNEGVDARDIVAEIKVNSDGSLDSEGDNVAIQIGAVSGKSLSSETATKIAATFNAIFKNDAKFNQLTSGYAVYSLNEKTGRIEFHHKATAGNVNTLTTHGFTISYNTEELKAYKDSYFGQMDQKDLLSDVDAAMDWASGHEGLWANVVVSEDFLKFVKNTFGKEYSAMTEDEQMSALVFYTANKSEKVDSDALLDRLIANNGGNLPTSDDDSVDIAGYALQYALALAYYRENHQNEADPDVDTVLNYRGEKRRIWSDEEDDWVYVYPYTEWLEQNGKQNMDGYLSAMGMISQNTGNISPDVLLGGFGGNTTLEGMLEDVLNQQP